MALAIIFLGIVFCYSYFYGNLNATFKKTAKDTAKRYMLLNSAIMSLHVAGN